MKIALIGYGKMGRAIERIAMERGHEIVARIDIDNRADMDSEAFLGADVAIEFTTPATAVENYLECFKRGVKVVSGTTGWLADKKRVEEACEKCGGTFFWTSNFSIGVNIFFAVNRYLARIMESFPQYGAEMTEIHHIHKLDHPSGTAITLAEGIIDENARYSSWTEEAPSAGRLLINHKREGEVPGTHIIKWDSSVDTISIEHEAKSRDGFALGAVMAAEFASTRRGLLTMEQMMKALLSPRE